MAEASHNVIPLITKTKKPSVRMIRGQESILSRGRTTEFTSPSIMAIPANIVQASRSTRILGTSQAATTREILVTTQRIRSLMRGSAVFRIHPRFQPALSRGSHPWDTIAASSKPEGFTISYALPSSNLYRDRLFHDGGALFGRAASPT